jgi:hypothetical protein
MLAYLQTHHTTHHPPWFPLPLYTACVVSTQQAWRLNWSLAAKRVLAAWLTIAY